MTDITLEIGGMRVKMAVGVDEVEARYSVGELELRSVVKGGEALSIASVCSAVTQRVVNEFYQWAARENVHGKVVSSPRWPGYLLVTVSGEKAIMGIGQVAKLTGMDVGRALDYMAGRQRRKDVQVRKSFFAGSRAEAARNKAELKEIVPIVIGEGDRYVIWAAPARWKLPEEMKSRIWCEEPIRL